LGKGDTMNEQQQTAGGLGFEALHHAIEQSDAASLTSFYAEDAEILTVNCNSTPALLRCSAVRR
jgi:hypothetical protein